MIIISHRGNIDGTNPRMENSPSYIQTAIDNKFQVEIDLWYVDNILWLGHDEPQYKIELEWLSYRKDCLWIHAKNFQALEFLTTISKDFKYFWHAFDEYTIVSTKHIWAHNFVGLKKTDNCIVPLLDKRSLETSFSSNFYAICTDYSTLCKKLFYEK